MSPLKDTLVALGAGVAIAVVVSCGGAAKSAKTASPGASDAGTPGVAGPRNSQIEELDRKISEAYAKLDAGPRPVAPPMPTPTMAGSDTVTPVSAANVKSHKDDPTCKPGAAQTCTDICELADSICKNARSICEIAEELAGDAWAAEKCSSGKTSCETANTKCCGCS